MGSFRSFVGGSPVFASLAAVSLFASAAGAWSGGAREPFSSTPRPPAQTIDSRYASASEPAFSGLPLQNLPADTALEFTAPVLLMANTRSLSLGSDGRTDCALAYATSAEARVISQPQFMTSVRAGNWSGSYYSYTRNSDYQLSFTRKDSSGELVLECGTRGMVLDLTAGDLDRILTGRARLWIPRTAREFGTSPR